MKTMTFGAAVVLALTAGQAWGADAPVRAVKAGPAYDPCGVARFAGLYYGGSVGATGYTAHRDDQDGFLTDNAGWTATDIAPSAGVQIGYDWQSCNQVFGVVADWSWTSAEAFTRDEPNDPLDNQFVRSRMQWYSTFRARAGFAVDDALYYVTGGIAAARIKTNIAELENGDDFTFSKTRWGLVGGAGAEYMLGNNWSFTAEVLYMRFADQSVTFIDSGAATRSFDLNDSAIVARIGLNYRWGGTAPAHVPPMPVKAASPVYTCGPARFRGGYVGGNVGVNNYTSNPNDLDGFLTDNGGWTQTDIAATAGVQAGYDWQSCHKVFGWVADLNWSNAKTTVLDNPNVPGSDNAFRSSMDWFATFRARAGVAVNDALIYLTGGVAVARIDSGAVDAPDNFSFDKTRWGLVGGVGAEFALGNNWSFNSELLYMQFAKHTATGSNGVDTFSFDFADSAWIGRVGLNYRWGDPGPATAAGIPLKAPPMGYACGPARFQGGYFGGTVGGLHYTAARNDNDGFLTDNSGWTATDIAATAGVQAGYDWQSCNKVFGWVADANWTNASALTVDDPNVGPGPIRSDMDWYGTLRARAGLASNNALVYLTGGVAVARIGTAISEPPVAFNFDKTRWGFVGGAGAEFVLGNNWSFSTELLYMQFAKHSATGNDGVDNFRFDLNDSALVGRVGLNYRFSTADIPVHVKY